MKMAGHGSTDMNLLYTLADQQVQDAAVRARQESLIGKTGEKGELMTTSAKRGGGAWLLGAGEMVDPGGLEPPALSVSRIRSNQLS